MENKKILIIEDDMVLRENMCDFLKEEGYEVTTAVDGLEGVSMAVSQLPDIILCDISMPGMSGLELCKMLQQMKATSVIPLIFVTAKSEKEDIRAGMQLGAEDYISKPFDLDELKHAVKVRLDKQERIKNAYDEKFYTLIDNPLSGVFIYVEDKFLFVNEAFAKIFGMATYEFENIVLEDLVVDDTKELVSEKIRRVFKGIQDSFQVKFESFHKKEQKNLYVEIFANVIVFKGMPALIGNAIDLSQSENNKISFKDSNNSENLTKREIEILKQVCAGRSTAEIAEVSFISPRTVDTHRANLLEKTGAKNTAELILYALKKGIFVF